MMFNLKQVKEFAEKNFCDNSPRQLYVDDKEFAVTNPWIDRSGRFELTDEEAVREWGLELIITFCLRADQRMMIERKLNR